MPLFVVLCDGMTLDEGLTPGSSGASGSIAPRGTSPTRSSRSAEVPRTLSGKATEVPVKRILMGQPVEHVISRDALANPHALDTFIDSPRAALAQSSSSRDHGNR